MTAFLSSVSVTSGKRVQNNRFLCTILEQTEEYSIAETFPTCMEITRVERLVVPTVVSDWGLSDVLSISDEYLHKSHKMATIDSSVGFVNL